MKRWLKEPLIHFLVIGAVLFCGYAWLNRGKEDAPRVVRITAAEVDWLKDTWARQWQRPPSDQELRGLVTDYLKEGLLAREAEELGLAENDTIVRRRLAQKMEFLVQDTARLAEPSAGELREYYEANRERYQAPARVSFEQVYFKTEAAAREALRHQSKEGDRIMLEREYANATEQDVASVFGSEFAGQVFAIKPGASPGPVRSSYGFHLVRVDERQAGQARPFQEVRAQVLEEWHREQQDRAYEQFYSALFEKYDVVMDESVRPLIGPLAREVTGENRGYGGVRQ